MQMEHLSKVVKSNYKIYLGYNILHCFTPTSRVSELRWSKILVHLLVFQNKAVTLHQSRNSTLRDTAKWGRI